jgi:hypothetical protein
VSELEISLRAKDIAIANLWDSLRVSGMDSMDCAAFAIDGVLDAVGPLIVADAYRVAALGFVTGWSAAQCRAYLLAEADRIEASAVNL